ncbi:non-ribosomal peptide synthetase [Chitinophaga rhizophila]|uniref:Amino acid adenylation domain-containing protein n=1 Tax=Chitinophaga rhizophila TaxID=2866212 RepID=A0ABS7GAH1_9BACT|nr:non-ribosomal peptide synthetase [Chitinophaga rhizophila]MBW8684663.1 amino acid adenylation domain-containing protein [Chitinophaga rhizophila]
MNIDFSKAIHVLSKAKQQGMELFLDDRKLKLKTDEDIEIDPQLLEEIRQYKDEIIDFLHHDVATETVDLPAIEPDLRKETETLPLSFGQEALWLIDQLEGSVQYHMPSLYRINGQLDIQLLEEAFRFIIQRHEILRTVIRQDAGAPYQHVLHGNNWTLELLDGSAADLQDGLPVEPLTTWFGRPFDLSADYMLRAALIQLAEERYVLLINMHHIAADGWSLSILINELRSVYTALVNRRPALLPALRIQYADYALWQRRLVNDGLLEAQSAYWKAQLSGVTTLALPYDFIRPAVQSTRGALVKYEIDAALTKGLRQLAQAEQATLYMTMLTALKVLLYRYSGETDIVVGTVIAARQEQELEVMIGFFANTLALRTEVNGSYSFRSLLQQVRETTLSAYERQDLPFEKVVELLGGERDRGHHPIYDIIFTMQNAPEIPVLSLGDAALSAIPHQHSTSQFDLNITALEKGDLLEINVEYCTDLFLPASVDRLFAHYITLLRSAVARPEEQVDRLSLTTDRLYTPASQSSLPYPADKPVGEIFSKQAAMTPAATALIFEDTNLTYEELEAASNQLAAYLLQSGITSETMVPVCLDRSADLIVTLLGILKAGAAFVPLDPRYPQQRIEQMLSDTDYKLAITNSEYRDLFNSKASILTLEALQPILGLMPSTALPVDIKADSLAYVMYTSGSTGRPKGVMVTHQNIVSLALGSGFLDWSSADVLLSTGSPSFDASTIEYWGTLLNGATLVLCPEDQLLDSAQLKEEIAERGVTRMWFTAGWLNQLVDTDISVFAGLNTVIAGGEKLSTHHIGRLRDAYPDLAIINGYGPTENTTFSLTYTIKAVAGNASIPIGYPLANRSAYVLDHHLVQLPTGVPGELYVGGAGLSRGYLHQPELTAERFIHHPVSGERLYRTGDLARVLPDGSIAYLGRGDDQVKLRGFRIELGEIERVLQDSGYISQGVVVLRGDGGSKHLVAYVVPEDDYEASALQSYLEQRLPDYMIPSVVMTLSALPLTNNGKVDKHALPDPAADQLHAARYVGARNAAESQLISIWEEALQVERIGVHDDFFRLGGDSIIAIGVISRIRQVFNRSVRLYDLYQQPTISELALLLEQSAVITPTESAEHIAVKAEIAALKAQVLSQLEDTSNIEDIYPMSDIQGGMVSASLLNPELAVYHDQFAHSFVKELDIPLFERAFSLMIDKYEIFRTSFNLDLHPEGVQVLHKEVPVHFNRLDWQELDGDTAKGPLAAFLEQQRSHPIDVKNPPLWRGTLIALADRYIFVLEFHHAMIDGWSMASFNTELNNLYVKLKAGIDVTTLPSLRSNYKDFIIESIIEKRNDQQKQFWKEELNDYKRLDIFTHEPDDQHLAKAYDAGFLVQLKEKAQRDDISVKSIFLGAYLYVLTMLTHEGEITTGIVTNNRPLIPDGERMLGCFLNSIPVRIRKGSTLTTWKQWFAGVEEKLVALKQHDRTSLFEIRKITGESFAEENAFFDTLFNFVNFHVYTRLEGGLFLSDISAVHQEDTVDSGFESTNTYMNCAASITNDVMIITWSLRKQLKCGASLEELHSWFDAVLERYLYNYEEAADRSMVLQAVPDRLLQAVNNDLIYPADKTVGEIFSTQATATPSATAVIFEDTILTYEELEAAANQLAAYLLQSGVTPEMLIPVCLDRSADLIVTLLGILKAGATFVPLDPRYPKQRIEQMLSDTDYKLAITSSEYRDLFDSEVKVLTLEALQPILGLMPATALPVYTKADGLAYVMYTSGSTGRPKGVMVTHRNIVSLALGSGFLDWSSTDVLLSTGSPSFDASTIEYWGTLLNGATLVLCAEDRLLDTAQLKEEIQDRGVTCMWFTAGWLNQLVDTDISIFTGLKTIMAGGEKLSAAHISRLRDAYPELNIINGYGPTENTTFSLTYAIKDVIAGGSVPIGYPLSNRSAFILDDTLQVLPVGVPGELYVGGAGLSRGYLNQPALTTARFIYHPGTGERMYHTGDLARVLPDGSIAYLGRTDDQVKLRGFRIELGEIESVLQDSGYINRGVVVLRGEGSSKHLLAYVVPEAHYEEDALLSYLSERLPDYMIPSAVITLEVFPLTNNGKIDKRALPDPDGHAMQSAGYVAPLTNTEVTIARIWQEVLQLDRVSIHDDFFRLGGDSITAIGVISRLRKAFGDHIKLYDLYRSGTLSQLALLIDSTQASIVANEPTSAISAAIEATKTELMAALPDAAAIEDIYPLSDIQSGMIYASLLSPDKSIYHDQFAYMLPADLDIERFTHAFSLLVQQHGTLRTIFDLNLQEQGVQLVYKQLPVSFNYLDYSRQGKEAAAMAIRSYLEAERQRPFKVTELPLWRGTIVKLADRHVFLFQFHHVLLDGWSAASLNTALGNIYEQLAIDPALSLPALKATYKDFVIEQLVDKQSQRSRTYWQQTLSGYKRLDIFTSADEEQRIVMHYDNAFFEKLKQLAQDNDMSLKGVFLGAFLYVFGMLTYEDEVTIGIVTNNRPLIEDGDKIFGCFLNALPFRFSTQRKDLTWRQWFQHVEEQLLDLKQYERLSLSEITRLNGEQAQQENPFFDVLFNFINFHVFDGLDANLLSMNIAPDNQDESLVFNHETSNTFLDCSVDITGNRLSVVYTIRRQLQSGKTVAELHQYLDAVLEAYINRQDELIAREQILHPLELERIMKVGNGHISPLPATKTITAAFQEQVGKRPDAIALACEQEIFTYQELNEQSDRLSIHLQQAGVKNGSLVPIYIERSPALIIGILGILKAGAAYLPLDPAYPAVRLNSMLEETHSSLLLSVAGLKGKLQTWIPAGITSCFIDKMDGADQQVATLPTTVAVAADSLAYVMYTSGSTGRPKGVMVTHHNVVSLALHSDFTSFTSEDVLLSTGSPSFDATTIEYWGMLLNGGCLVLSSEQQLLDVSQLAETIRSKGVSKMWFTSSWLNQLVEEDISIFEGLTTVMAGGERLSPAHIMRLRQAYPGLEIINGYGPTENTTFSLTYGLEAELPTGDIPIGKPLPYRSAWVLDKQQQLLPLGVAGELCVGGAGLSKGYLHHPELTIKRFVQHPLHSETQIVYRTGDLTRWLPDGNMEYIDRIDEQVKIRGFRVEPGEIENILLQSGTVRQAVVILQTSRAGNKQLVAFVVPEQNFHLSALTAFLESRLPAVMVPSQILTLDKIPLTVNGKADKKTLLQHADNVQQEKEFIVASTDMEKQLVEIWRLLLGREKISISDDFFELGGHSLLAMRLNMHIKRSIGVNVPIKRLFLYRTIEELAAYLDELIARDTDAGIENSTQVFEI